MELFCAYATSFLYNMGTKDGPRWKTNRFCLLFSPLSSSLFLGAKTRLETFFFSVEHLSDIIDVPGTTCAGIVKCCLNFFFALFYRAIPFQSFSFPEKYKETFELGL